MSLWQEFFGNPLKRPQSKESHTSRPLGDSTRIPTKQPDVPPQNDDYDSGAGEQMIWHVIEQSGLPEAAAEISRQLDAQGVTDPRIRGETLIAGLKAAMSPSWKQRLASVLCRTSRSLRNRLVERITGIRQVDLSQLSDDLFSESGQQRLEERHSEEDEIIRQAWKSPSVQRLAAEIGITEDHIRDVYNRLQIHGNLRMTGRAITNVNLLRWYYTHGGKDNHLGPDEAIQLWVFARDGKLQ